MLWRENNNSFPIKNHFISSQRRLVTLQKILHTNFNIQYESIIFMCSLAWDFSASLRKSWYQNSDIVKVLLLLPGWFKAFIRHCFYFSLLIVNHWWSCRKSNVFHCMQMYLCPIEVYFQSSVENQSNIKFIPLSSSVFLFCIRLTG